MNKSSASALYFSESSKPEASHLTGRACSKYWDGIFIILGDRKNEYHDDCYFISVHIWGRMSVVSRRKSYNQSSTFIWPGVPDPANSAPNLAQETSEIWKGNCLYGKLMSQYHLRLGYWREFRFHSSFGKHSGAHPPTHLVAVAKYMIMKVQSQRYRDSSTRGKE